MTPSMPTTRSQSTVAAAPAQDANPVIINWLLFCPSSEPKILSIRVPHDRFTDAIQQCREQFATEILKEHKFKADVSTMKFWQPNEPLPLSTFDRLEWPEYFSDLKAVSQIIHYPRSLSSVLPGNLNLGYVHMLISVDAVTEEEDARKEALDIIAGLSENQRYVKVLKYDGKAPSTGAKSKEYMDLQRKKDFAILDGRYAPDGFSTVAPPIQIFHPVFESFTRRLETRVSRPNPEFLSLIRQFTKEASKICLTESARAKKYRGILRDILGSSVVLEPNDDGTVADGVISLEIDRIHIRILMIELKREIGEGGCDPTIQASLSAHRYWVKQESFNAIRDRCCCPTLILAGGGPWMVVLGGVLTDRPIVQRLTDMLWIGHSSTHQEVRIEHLARVFLALRTSAEELGNFYRNLIHNMTEMPAFDQRKLDHPHPRFYPYITYFPQDSQMVSFKYVQRLEDDPGCVTFLAQTTAFKTRDIVVKFVTTYGDGVHRFLADKGYAPQLLYCGPIPEADTILANIPLPMTEGAIDRRLLPLMRMVVMDYVKPSGYPAEQVAREQLERLLDLLHDEGYVFGDLRKPNILFDVDKKLKLIDFDWAGCQGAAHYPLDLSKGIQWAQGVSDLALILPQHDLEMKDILLESLYP